MTASGWLLGRFLGRLRRPRWWPNGWIFPLRLILYGWMQHSEDLPQRVIGNNIGHHLFQYMSKVQTELYDNTAKIDRLDKTV